MNKREDKTRHRQELVQAIVTGNGGVVPEVSRVLAALAEHGVEIAAATLYRDLAALGLKPPVRPGRKRRKGKAAASPAGTSPTGDMPKAPPKRRKRGRPPAADDGRRVQDLPRLSSYMEPRTKARLTAASALLQTPVWRMVQDAVEAHLAGLPAADRRLVDQLAERMEASP